MLDTAEITNIAVLKEYRNKKVGFKLVNQMISDLIDLDISEIFLEVRENNIGAISLYKKAGFKIIGKREKYYTNPIENALIMKFEINAGDSI